ncbi:uncharacterized protein [Chelonus insularis]|uniref:uncharacterized protein isoform X2 n=1 Tax=Chelonus insularis TaxID=460826 RepID=UPI00158C91CC|nr:uncharacterized protein LOC118063826 isoform X2 [Chelonus insularis]
MKKFTLEPMFINSLLIYAFCVGVLHTFAETYYTFSIINPIPKNLVAIVNGYVTICVGVIISEKHVLVRKECLTDWNSKSTKLKIGAGNTVRGYDWYQQFVNISQINDFTYDLSIVLLNHTIKLNEQVQVAQLPTQDVHTKKNAIVSGWTGKCSNDFKFFVNRKLMVVHYYPKECGEKKDDEFCGRTKYPKKSHSTKDDGIDRVYKISEGAPMIDSNGVLIGYTRFGCKEGGPVVNIYRHVSKQA